MAFKRPGDKTLFALIGVCAALITLFAFWYRPWLFTTLDLKVIDAFFVLRGNTRPPSDVVIVAVDEKSINQMGRWPWSREVTAKLVGALKPARVVAYDIVFAEPQNAVADKALGNAIKDADNAVLGFFFRDDSTEAPDTVIEAQLKRSTITRISYLGDGAAEGFAGVEFSGVDANIPVIGLFASSFGSFNIIPQDDGLYRAANLVFKYNDAIYPSLALEALRSYFGKDLTLHIAPYGIDGLSVGDARIPLDEEGAYQVNYYGPALSFATYSASDVINGKVGEASLKDKLVFVGVTEKGIYDIRPTPLDTLLPGVEIHATVAANVIEKRFLVRDSRVTILDLALVVLLPVLLALIATAVHRTYISLAVFAGFFTALILGEFYLFSSFNLKPSLIYPLFSLSTGYLFIEAYRNVVVEKKGRFLKRAFTQYVSEQVLSEIIKNPDSLNLGGEARVVTVLFSDIRGFTTISESLTPQKLVTLLNEYLNPMTMIVLEEHGLLDKYIGDAIMVIFNAPIAIDDHPGRACSSALRMLSTLKELNAGWALKGYPRVDIGIGINTGEAVVGNMGSVLRFDYTGIGDNINLASRLEGLNKLYGSHIIVSRFTYEFVKDAFVFRELDLVKVKGKDRPVGLYELMAVKGDADSARLCEEFSKALAMFRAERFDEAKAAFEKVLELYPNDGPSNLYVARAGEYALNPPPEGWDGVYVAKTK
ncbi:MAG: CHASE2 domain-containing protein [Deltaproteobacteria bacterium]|nr:CHASE2 domain-containing protein [Deltaproteobacteria bacterium]